MKDFKNNIPETSKIRKEPPFRVPENYFDDFSARLQLKLAADTESHPQKKKGIVRFLKPALGLAASFAIIFMLVYWPMRSFVPEYVAETTDLNYQESDIETYIPSFERIDENSFFSIIAEAVSGAEETEKRFNDEELLNYLSANVSDYELYLNIEN